MQIMFAVILKAYSIRKRQRPIFSQKHIKNDYFQEKEHFWLGSV